MIFAGGGGGGGGSAHYILIRPHIVWATRRCMSLTPLMQVLLMLGYYATEAYFLIFGDTLGVSKDATTRAVYTVYR